MVNWWWLAVNDVKKSIAEIDKHSTAEAYPIIHGMWESITTPVLNKFYKIDYQCSNCKQEPKDFTNYCPNCDAKMYLK